MRESKDNKKDYLTTKQIKRALSLIDRDTPQGLRNYALFTLMVTCGLRDIEAARVNVGDLGSVGDNTVLYVHGKGRTDKSDFIRVSEAAEIILRDYLTKAGITEPGAPIFQSLSNNSRGRRLSTRSISQIIKNILKRAGYDSDRLTAHSLRHSAVTISLLGGKTLQEAQQFARHANIATTQVYAHNLDKAGNDCSDTVSKAIFERER